MRLAKYLLFIFFIFISLLSTAQTNQDSIEILYEDSIAKIPIELSSFKYNDFRQIQNLPVENYIIKSEDYFGLYKTPNYGSPIANERSFFPTYKEYNLGFHSNDYYRKDFNNFEYIDCNKPYSETHTSQGRAFVNSQSKIIDNLNVNALFASRYQKNIHMLLRYDRINQKGLYAHDRNRVSSFQGGIHHFSKNNKFSISLNFISNTIYNEHSNGILTDTVLPYANFQVRESVSLYSTSASTTVKDEQYGIYTSYAFGELDKFLRPKLEFSSVYKQTKDRFLDENPKSSLSEYKTIPIDSEYIHRYYDQYNWINSAYLKLPVLNGLHLESSITHQYCHQYFDTFGIDPTRISFELGGNYQWRKNIKLQYKFYTDNDKQVSNEINIQLGQKNIGQLDLKLFQQQIETYKPLLFFVINKKLVWKNDFSFVNYNGISIKFNPQLSYIPNVEYSSCLINKLVYLNEYSRPEQINDNTLYQQIKINSYLKWKSLATENKFSFTVLSPDKPHWNSWSTSHSIFLQAKLIKKIVDSRIGINILNHQPSFLSRYDPITALYYYLQGDGKPEYALQYNAFMHFRVSEFTFTLDMENLESFWQEKPTSLVYHCPIYDFYLRFGIKWRFTY